MMNCAGDKENLREGTFSFDTHRAHVTDGWIEGAGLSRRTKCMFVGRNVVSWQWILSSPTAIVEYSRIRRAKKILRGLQNRSDFENLSAKRLSLIHHLRFE